MITRLFFIILIVLMNAQDANSQIFQRKKKRDNEPAPKAILVEIKTHMRRQQYYQQRGFTEKQKQLLIDIDSIRDRMMMDFNDNFTYCPVYFYIDTSRSRVLAGKFEGVLLDSHLKPATDIMIQPSDNYQIVYFGYMISAPEPQNQTSNQDLFAAAEVNTRSNRQRLVVLDKYSNPVKKPLPKSASSAKSATLRKEIRAYKYRSPMHEVYYMPYAGNLNLKLYSFYGMYPYKQ